MRIGRTIIIASACIALSAPAEARPRIFRYLGAVVGTMGIIGGAARARAHQRRGANVPRQEATADPRRQEAADPRTDKRNAVVAVAGPPFWPYAFDDMFGYVFGLRGAADRFWAHGYRDVLDAMFVTGGAPDARVERDAARFADNNATVVAQHWQRTCGSETANPAAALGERIRSAVDPTPEQGAALDAFQEALTRAAARIASACPATPPADASNRLNAMAARLLAMRQAGTIVLAPLRNLYAALNDEQKSRLASLDAEANNSGDRAAPSGAAKCTSDAVDWPAATIARRVAPRREQFKDLEMLRLTSASFEKFVATTCASDRAQTPPERLDAAQKRLSVIRYAATHVRPAVDQFFGSLSPAQKARVSSLAR